MFSIHYYLFLLYILMKEILFLIHYLNDCFFQVRNNICYFFKLWLYQILQANTSYTLDSSGFVLLVHLFHPFPRLAAAESNMSESRQIYSIPVKGPSFNKKSRFCLTNCRHSRARRPAPEEGRGGAQVKIFSEFPKTIPFAGKSCIIYSQRGAAAPRTERKKSEKLCHE